MTNRPLFLCLMNSVTNVERSVATAAACLFLCWSNSSFFIGQQFIPQTMPGHLFTNKRTANYLRPLSYLYATKLESVEFCQVAVTGAERAGNNDFHVTCLAETGKEAALQVIVVL